MSANFKDIRWNAPIEPQRSLQKTNRPAVTKRSLLARFFWPAAAYVARRSIWIAVGFLIMPAKPGSVNYRSGINNLGSSIKLFCIYSFDLAHDHLRAKLNEAKTNIGGFLDEPETGPRASIVRQDK